MRLALFACLLLLGGGSLRADTPPKIVIGDQQVPCSPPPVLIRGEVHVPASFHFTGLPITVSTEEGFVTLRGLGEAQARVPSVMQDGLIYYPIVRACAGVRLGARWVEHTGKVYIAPRIDSVRPELFDRLLTLRIAAGYPIMPRVSVLKDPGRVLIEVPNAHLFTEATTIPVGSAGIARVRAAQHSYEPSMVRIVVDVQGLPQYRLLTSGPTTQVRLRISVPEANTPEACSVVDQLLDSPGTDAAGAAAATAVEVTGVTAEADPEGNTRIVVRTTGPADGKVIPLSSPPRLALDIENATDRSEPPSVSPDLPLVVGVRVGQFAPTTARVVVDLAEEVSYTLDKGSEPGMLVLTLRNRMGMVAVHGIKGLKIWIDAGHGGSLHGTTGLSGRREQDVNLDVAIRVARLLEQAEARPAMTRWGDDTVGLRARPARANANGAHLFISIHCNANGRANSARGIETYYCSAKSYRLARAVHYRLVRELGAPDRRVRQRPGLVVTRETRMPSILVEIGYMNHREEDRLLGTPEYRQRVAKAIFNGILQHVGAAPAIEDGQLPGSGDADGNADVAAVVEEEQQ